MSDLLVRLQAVLADRYAIERELGHGGMAVVFLASRRKWLPLGFRCGKRSYQEPEYVNRRHQRCCG